jgi:hypothetical protein
MPVPTLRQWRNGEIFNARDYVYERNLLIAEINRLASILGNTTDTAVIFTSSSEPTGQNNGDLWFHEYQ